MSLNGHSSISGTFAVDTVANGTTFTYIISSGAVDSTAVTVSNSTAKAYGYIITFAKTNTNINYTVTANSSTLKAIPGVSYATTSGNIAETALTTASIKCANPDMQKLINSLEAYLQDKKMVGAVVYGEPVEWTDVEISMIVNVRPLYNKESVRAAVEAAIRTVFSYDKVSFGSRISIGDVYRSALAVDGVDYVTLNMLRPVGYTTSTTVDIDTVSAGSAYTYKLPRLSSTGVTITASGGLANT